MLESGTDCCFAQLNIFCWRRGTISNRGLVSKSRCKISKSGKGRESNGVDVCWDSG